MLGSTIHTEIPLQDFERLLDVFPLPFPPRNTVHFWLCKSFQSSRNFSCTKAHDTSNKSLQLCYKLIVVCGCETDYTLDANTFSVVLIALSHQPVVTVNQSYLVKLHPDSKIMFTTSLRREVLLFQSRSYNTHPKGGNTCQQRLHNWVRNINLYLLS